MLQTHDGRVATVHHSQIKKTESGFARPRPVKRIKLTPQDKKLFVEDVKRYLVYVCSARDTQMLNRFAVMYSHVGVVVSGTGRMKLAVLLGVKEKQQRLRLPCTRSIRSGTCFV